MSEDVIRTENVPRCPLCSTDERRILYAGLRDRLFGAPGEWTLKECVRCGLVFLDPRPLEMEIKKAYRAYYTHEEAANTANSRDGSLRFVLKLAFQFSKCLVNRMLLVTRERDHINSMYLHELPPGRLLDVGCGQGRFLDHMRRMGWLVEGVEPDPRAAKTARAMYGITVHVSDLAAVRYPDKHFDAIAMNHVIEHVHDPIALLQECRRILRPGGVLVAVTPNIRSWGHRQFARNWMNLDPPRHLQLLSPANLKRCAELAGYNEVIRTWTTAANAEVFFVGSLEIRDTQRHIMDGRPSARRRLHALLLQYQEALLTKLFTGVGEEAVLWLQNG